MIILACADVHSRKVTPHYRCDDYWGTAQGKLEWVVSTGNKKKAKILIAGDIFDSSLCGTDVLNTVMKILQKADTPPWVVPGQHDLLFHTDLHKTPLWNLHQAGVVQIIGADHPMVLGVAFEEEIPDVKKPVLLIHKCITEEKPPFFLEDAVSAKDMLTQHPQFKYIISGDYHTSHYTKLDGRHLINCGSIMRNKKDMHAHVPKVWLIDTEKDTVKPLKVPHKPFGDVFNLDAIEKDKDSGITLDTSKLNKLLKTDIEGIKFDDVVWKVVSDFEKDKIAVNKKLVKEVLQQCLSVN